MFSLIYFLVIGLIAGALARFLVPGEDKMGIGGTLGLGVVGAFVGGLLAVIFTSATLASFGPSGLIGSVIGGIVALLVYRQIKK